MKIKKVRSSGFEKLYNGYEACIKDNRAGFGDGLFTFLNHVMVSLELEEITAIELFYLKKFASSVKVISHDYGNFVSEKDAVDLNQKIGGLLEIHQALLHDSDIDKDVSQIDNLLPIGCHQYHVVAIFKGSKVVSITGSLIQNLFKDEKGQFEDIYVGNMIIENRLATAFYNAFYSFISAEMTNIDIITEFITDRSYFRFADSPCSLAHINSPYGEIVLYGNSQEGLNHQIMVVKDSMQTSPYILNEFTYLTFCLRTTFQTFMNFYLDSPYVIDHENLKITFNSEEILLDDEILAKYSARIHDSLDYLVDFRKGLAKSAEINLMKFNYLFGGNPISYSLQIPLSDILSGVFDVTTHLVDNFEMKSIYTEISKLSNIARSIFG